MGCVVFILIIIIGVTPHYRRDYVHEAAWSFSLRTISHGSRFSQDSHENVVAYPRSNRRNRQSSCHMALLFMIILNDHIGIATAFTEHSLSLERLFPSDPGQENIQYSMNIKYDIYEEDIIKNAVVVVFQIQTNIIILIRCSMVLVR